MQSYLRSLYNSIIIARVNIEIHSNEFLLAVLLSVTLANNLLANNVLDVMHARQTNPSSEPRGQGSVAVGRVHHPDFEGTTTTMPENSAGGSNGQALRGNDAILDLNRAQDIA